MVPGPQTSWVISTSALTQTLSPACTRALPAARARIFSVSVIELNVFTIIVNLTPISDPCPVSAEDFLSRVSNGQNSRITRVFNMEQDPTKGLLTGCRNGQSV